MVAFGGGYEDHGFSDEAAEEGEGGDGGGAFRCVRASLGMAEKAPSSELRHPRGTATGTHAIFFDAILPSRLDADPSATVDTASRAWHGAPALAGRG